MNQSFSQEIPALQIFWDSTSLGTFKECPRKYELSIKLGYVPRETNVHLTFGLFYHAALETYDKEKAKGASHDGALRASVLRALTDTWDFDRGRPWNSDDKYKNRYTLVRTIIWYLEHFKEDIAQTVILANGKPAVELSFRFQTDYKAPSNENYWLCGHLDRLALINDEPYILDRKTSKNSIENGYFDKYNPDNQMSTYDLAGKVVYGIDTKGIIIDAAQVLITGSRFRRGFTHRTPEQRNEFLNDTAIWLGYAASCATRNYWPMNDKSCGNYGGCPYRGICNKSPLARQEWLDNSFHNRVWDPLQVRGDI
jgi:hypothetical protein